MKHPLLIIAAIAATTSLSSAALFNLSGPMDGAQANAGAGTGSAATGTISGTYDDATNNLMWSIAWDSASLDNGTSSETALHFHGPAAPGVNGGVQIGIGVGSNPATGSATLSAGQEADILAGLWYVNLHTSAFGGGEIRGQVITTPVPEPSSALLAIVALPMLLRRKRG